MTPAPQAAGKTERNRKPGVSYAVTNAGVELPVIDVTHPAFELTEGAKGFFSKRDAFSKMQQRQWLPGPARRIVHGLILRNSVLWKAVNRASGGFLPGMDTYLLKLGPANLGQGYSGYGDRMIAASFPVTSLRMRLRETSRLLADGIGQLLARKPGCALHMINIAGGHASDSLNALILCRRGNPGLLDGRRIVIHVLDLEREAPDFGGRALAALSSAEGPLRGLDVSLEYVRYDWREPSVLAAVLAGLGPDSAAVASSEGGLFEYGSDADIAANLAALAGARRAGLFVVGSVTRDDDFGRSMRRLNGIAVICRGLVRFTEIIRSAGWTVHEAVELPFSDVVRLDPATA